MNYDDDCGLRYNYYILSHDFLGFLLLLLLSLLIVKIMIMIMIMIAIVIVIMIVIMILMITTERQASMIMNTESSSMVGVSQAVDSAGMINTNQDEEVSQQVYAYQQDEKVCLQIYSYRQVG